MSNNQRKLKVQPEARVNKRGYLTHEVATVKISGRWFEKAGFRIGEFVKVVVSDNLIQIIKEKE